MRIPLINAREWRLIAPLLPPPMALANRARMIGCIVCEFSMPRRVTVPWKVCRAVTGNRTKPAHKAATWQRDGTLEKVMTAGKPAIARMHDEYIQRLRAHSDDARNWGKPIFGTGVIPKLPHAQPRGRYAGRQRVPTADARC